jgi:hypothetical protein
VVRGANTLSPWTGLGLFVLFVAVVSVVAYSMLNRRNA